LESWSALHATRTRILDGASQILVLHDFGFHHLNLRTNRRVLIELEFLEPIDVRLRDLVTQDIHRVENTHYLHSLQLIPFLDFDCLFPVICRRSNKKPFFSFWTGFYFLSVPGPLRPSTVFVQDRGVSEGFSAELARDSTW
jgi:hypothetical protein